MIEKPEDFTLPTARFPDRILYILLFTYFLLSPFTKSIPVVTNVIVLILGVGILIDVLHYRYRFSITRTQFGILALVSLSIIMGVFSTATAKLPIAHLSHLKTLFLYGIVIVVAARALITRNRVRNAWMAIAGSASAIGYLSAANAIIGLPFGGEVSTARTISGYTFVVPRTIGVPIDYGSYGILISIGLAIVIGTSLNPERWYSGSPTRIRVINLFVLSGLLSGVYVGQSRSTFVATVATISIVVSCELLRRNNIWKRAIVVSSTVLSVLLLTVAARKIAVALYQVNSLAVTARLHQYTVAIDLLASNPLFGVGWGYFTQVVTPVGVHNFWLLMGLGLGVPGVVAWVGVFGLILLGGYRFQFSNDSSRTGLGGVVLGGLVGVMIELLLYPGFFDYVAIFVGLAVGALGVRNRQSNAMDSYSR